MANYERAYRMKPRDMERIVCPACDTEVVGWFHFTQHMLNHPRKKISGQYAGYYCFCGQWFPNWFNLARHLQSIGTDDLMMHYVLESMGNDS